MTTNAIWHQHPSLAQLNSAKNTLVEHLGIEFIERGDDFIKARMPVDHRTIQPMGLLHGGASVALAETLGSSGAYLCVDPAMQKPHRLNRAMIHRHARLDEVAA